MSSASFVTAMLWGKTSRPAPRVSTLVPLICIVDVLLLTGQKDNR